MAGTLFGLGLSQQHDGNGLPMAGCKLYVFAANTSTPATTYQDSGLTAGLELPHPIEADANGRIPMFWVADGTYRARLTNTSGIDQFDEDNILAIGPSSGEGGGGGGVSASAIFQTGDPIFVPVTGTRSGWVRANARTIGSATSGASERANADCEDLFLHLWNTYSNTLCPVSTGRGANAAADWAANKTIGTLDMRGKGAFGVADMGNSDSGILDSVSFDVGSKTAAASQGGDALHTLVSGEMPSHGHTATVTDPGHLHSYNVNTISVNGPAVTINIADGSGGSANGTRNTNSGTTGITVANANTGGGGAHNNMPPFILGSWYLKL